jgi:SAM-dependent methyltransferase
MPGQGSAELDRVGSCAKEMSMNATDATHMETLKGKLKATWMAGNYDYFCRFMESSAVEFLARLPVRPGDRLLDVACGSGQLALLAARGGAKVTGVDIATNAIAAARARAGAEGLDAKFDEGDAEELPYADESFDVVATLYGAMFAPRPDRVARELVRVCRRGGTIGMANWTREGFVGRMLLTIGKFVAPPGMPSPLLWGDEPTVRERLGNTLADPRLTRTHYRFDYAFSPEGVVDFFRENYGPVHRAFAALPPADQASLREALVDVWSGANQSGEPGRTVVDAEYLEVLGTRPS